MLEYFNAEWYLKQYPEVLQAGEDPLVHFLKYGWKNAYNPGKDFNMQEYLNENSEIFDLGLPLLDYMQLMYSNQTLSKVVYPTEAQSFSECFNPLEKGKKLKRVVVFASMLYGSILHDYEKYFLEKLKEVSDAIIYIADSPILPNEFKKLSSLVNYAECKQHGEYDFGSYKYGLEYLKENINFEDIDELILCNNSSLAPIFPLENLFDTMKKKNVDFWGITSSEEIISHLQTYFLGFNNKIINSTAFLDFFQNVQQEESRLKVIFKYELRLTGYLQKHGFTCDAFFRGYSYEKALDLGFQSLNFTTYPCYLMIQHSVALVKIGSLTNTEGNYDGVENTLTKITKYNPELATFARKYRTKFAVNKNKWLKDCEEYIAKKEQLELLYVNFSKQIQAYKDKHREIFTK